LQEKVKYGLIDPPKNKVKMSNFMNIVKNEAISNPTKIEKLVKKVI